MALINQIEEQTGERVEENMLLSEIRPVQDIATYRMTRSLYLVIIQKLIKHFVWVKTPSASRI